GDQGAAGRLYGAGRCDGPQSRRRVHSGGFDPGPRRDRGGAAAHGQGPGTDGHETSSKGGGATTMIGDGMRMNLSRVGAAEDQGIIGFFHRRLMEAIGVALILLGLAYLLALISADAGDPSFNHAVDAP